eukprot:s402_g21.t1
MAESKLHSRRYERQYVLEAISVAIKARLRLCFLSWLAWQQEDSRSCRKRAAESLGKVQIVLAAEPMGDVSNFASNIHGQFGEVAVEPVTANAKNKQQGRQGVEDKSMGHKDVYRVEGKGGWPGQIQESEGVFDSLAEILKRGELRHSRLLKMAGSGYTADETSRRSREASEQSLQQSIQLQLKANQQRESNRRSQVSKDRLGGGFTRSSNSSDTSLRFGKRHHAVLSEARDLLALHLVMHAWKSLTPYQRVGETSTIPQHVEVLASRACTLARQWQLALEDGTPEQPMQH